MKKTRIFPILLVFVILSVGCQDEQKRFCTEATTQLCTLCEQCGDYKACGLTRVNNRAECIEMLANVCSAYDSLYSKEVSRACMQGIQQLNCATLKATGKPEVCTRLF